MAGRRTNRRRSRRRGGFFGQETDRISSSISGFGRRGVSDVSYLGRNLGSDTENAAHRATRWGQNAVGVVGNTLGNLTSGVQHAFGKVRKTLSEGGKYRKTKRKHRKHRKSKKSHKKH